MPAKVRGASGGVNWRRLAIRLHLWGGLLTGPFLLVLGLSGVALVFRAEIESLESATPAVASFRPGAASLDAVVGIARTRHPTAEPYALRIPSAPGRPYRVELRASRGEVEPRVLAGAQPEVRSGDQRDARVLTNQVTEAVGTCSG